MKESQLEIQDELCPSHKDPIILVYRSCVLSSSITAPGDLLPHTYQLESHICFPPWTAKATNTCFENSCTRDKSFGQGGADISGSILKRSEGIYQSSKWYCRLCTTCVTFQYTFSEVMKVMKCVQWTLYIWNKFLLENIYFVWKVMLIFFK